MTPPRTPEHGAVSDGIKHTANNQAGWIGYYGCSQVLIRVFHPSTPGLTNHHWTNSNTAIKSVNATNQRTRKPKPAWRFRCPECGYTLVHNIMWRAPHKGGEDPNQRVDLPEEELRADGNPPGWKPKPYPKTDTWSNTKRAVPASRKEK